MPFQKGNQLAKGAGGGRKGYAIEQEQLNKMKKLVNVDLALLDKIYKGKASEAEIRVLGVAADRIKTYLAKLHANKMDVTSDGKQITINVAKEIAQQNDIK